MHKIILTWLLLIVFNSQASAEDCPDFYRFVDFGLQAPDGTIHRGGATFRAESFDGVGLLMRDRSICREVRELAVDGRGNPIPVVSSVNYSPEMTGMDLQELRLSSVDDVAAETERNAAEHRAKLDQPGAVITPGPNYLCASPAGSDTVSCQLVSPFGGPLAPVVYCSRLECRMNALAVKENVIAAAIWRPSEAALQDREAMALEITDRVQQIHDFLAPLSS